MHPTLGRRRLLRFGMASLAVPRWPAQARSGLTEGYVAQDGTRLFYVRAGEGKLMLFLHGAPDDWSLYEDQLREFSRDHLTIAPNLRGFPPSDRPEAVEAYAMPRLLGDISAILDHFGAPRCILVGNDWGGYFAWVFASAYPDRVERLVILNAPHPAIHLREVRGNPEQAWASRYERFYNTAPAPYPAWFNYYRADPIKVAASVEEAASWEAPDLARHFFAGVATPPATTSLRVDVPTLVLWGMRDPVLLPGELDGIEDYAPRAVVLRIGDAGHDPMRSHPALVNRAIRDFLEGREFVPNPK